MAGNNIKRIVFLCSGSGGNLVFIQQAINNGWIHDCIIAAVISDRRCQANKFAEKSGIPSFCIDFKKDRQLNLSEQLEKLNPDLIITTVHKIIGESIVRKYKGRLINLHYSVLPAFSGLIGSKSVQAALDYGAKFSGVTAHLIDETLDGGEPLGQCVVTLNKEEPLDELMQVIFRTGCFTLLSAISSLLNNNSKSYSSVYSRVLGHHCLFNGDSTIDNEFINDDIFWRSIKDLTNFNCE